MRFFQATRLFGTSVPSVGELFFACVPLSRSFLPDQHRPESPSVGTPLVSAAESAAVRDDGFRVISPRFAASSTGVAHPLARFSTPARC
jgi:hypothetical protein